MALVPALCQGSILGNLLLSSFVMCSGLLLGACQRSEPTPAGATANSHPASTGGPQRIAISITADGFVPARSYARAGEPVTLVVTRRVEDTCAKDIVIEDYGILVPLPLGEPVAVRFTPLRPGRLRFASCAINMVAGEIVVE
jgi:plastocyanin domain-containing protein